MPAMNLKTYLQAKQCITHINLPQQHFEAVNGAEAEPDQAPPTSGKEV